MKAFILQHASNICPSPRILQRERNGSRARTTPRKWMPIFVDENNMRFKESNKRIKCWGD